MESFLKKSLTKRKMKFYRVFNMKNKYTAILLALFVGGIGIHRFYLGQTKIGLLYLVFCWTFISLIIAFFDFFYFLFSSAEKFNSVYNYKTGF